MRIVIDTTQAQKTKTGLKTYADSIISSIEKIDKDNKYFNWNAPKIFSSNNFLARALNGVIEIICRQLILSVRIWLNKIDIYYTPGYYSPVLCPAKRIIVIHDLIFLSYPQEYNFLSYQYLKLSTNLSIKRADYIIATSENTKKDIIKYYPAVSEEKIRVVYAAASNQFRKIENDTKEIELRKKLNIKNKYLMYAGGLTEHKNIAGLLKIFAEFKKIKGNFTQISYSLVMPGPYELPTEVTKIINELKLSQDIIYPGYVSLGDLVGLYNYAEVFVFPSYYEGFGIPPLEAMSCGCPVVASNRTSLPEVIGEGGVLCNPDDHKLFAKKIVEVESNPDYRRELIQNGLRQAAKFSWDFSAQETIAIFNRYK